jgi:hypothetical protein
VSHVQHAVGHDPRNDHLLRQQHHIQNVLVREAQLICV